MAKIQIKSRTPEQPAQASGAGYFLQIRVEWVSNQLTNDQWSEKSFLFSKVKVHHEEGDLLFDHWLGGFYREEGTMRISLAHFNLNKPLPEGKYTVRVYRSADAKTWVADGSVDITLGLQSAKSQSEVQPEYNTDSGPYDHPAEIRLVSGF